MQEISKWNVSEIGTCSLMVIDGGDGSWGQSLGFACGYLFGAATNAAEIIGDGLADALKGKILEGAFSR